MKQSFYGKREHREKYLTHPQAEKGGLILGWPNNLFGILIYLQYVLGLYRMACLSMTRTAGVSLTCVRADLELRPVR